MAWEGCLDSETARIQFIDLAKKWSLGYTNIIRTSLSFKRGDEWYLEYFMIVFFTDIFDEIDKLILPETVETETLLAIKEVVDFDENYFVELLNAEPFDPFPSSHEKYSTIIPSEARTNLWYYFEPFTRSEFPGNWRFPALSVDANSSNNKCNLPRKDTLDLELLSHEKPYSGLIDLLDTFAIPHSTIDRGYSSPRAVWLISNPATVLSSSKISDGAVKLEIRCPEKLDSQNLSVGMRILTGKPPIIRKSIPSPKFEWTNEGRWKKGVVEESIKDATVADIHLNYKDEFLGHLWINDPQKSLNPRHLFHKLFDKKNVIGSEFFNLKSDFFEDSISLLLNLFELSSVTYGGIPTLKEAPDILAYSQQGHLFVIECTTTDVGRSGKLLKLNQRCREIREAANQGGIGILHILPMMFTPLMREETKACWDEAANFGISLICHENIQHLINRVEAPPSPKELYDSAVALIPKKNNQLGIENLDGGG